MLIYVKIIKKMFFIVQTDGQTHVQLKTIVRNLTKLIETITLPIPIGLSSFRFERFGPIGTGPPI